MLAEYATRAETRRDHLIVLRQVYGFKTFSGHRARELKAWLACEAENATTNHDLARRFVDECRRTKTILPGVSVIERLCADALVAAERRIDSAIVARLEEPMKARLDALLTEMVDGKVSRFVWLRQFEVGQNSVDATRLLDRMEFLQEVNLSPDILRGIPPHRVSRLQRQGERYFADGLRDISSDRRLAILAVCAVAWRAALADAVIETHDRIVGKTWLGAKKLCDAKIADAKTAVQDTLRAFKSLGAALLDARSDGAPLDQATEQACGWERLEGLVATAAELTDTMAADPLAHVGQGYHRFRRDAPRMLRALDIQAAGVAAPLLQASTLIADDERPERPPVGFLRRGSKWHRHLNTCEEDGHRLWEVAVLFHLRDAFRSGDIWVPHSRRYSDLKQALVPAEAVKDIPRLAVPLDPQAWLADRKGRMTDGLAQLAKAARAGTIPGGSIENGMLTVLLAEGLNLGLSKMAEATNTHDYFQLSRLSRWHVESDAINQALAMVIEAQSRLPMAQFWGGGVTASSDGQFFPAARQGEAMNLINAKYGSEPGLKAYTHVSDQFGPFATQNIPATVSEAPYILDGLLMNEAGRKIREQYADTGGFTDHVFAVTSLLGFRFIPRIRDLPSRRLYLFDPASAPNELRSLIGGKIREGLIVQNWPGVLRSAATMVTGAMPPSQLLKKFAAYPRQHELAVALREIGRVERTLFVIEWLLDADMQRRAQIGLNKGEAHHALKNALRIGR